MRQKDIMLLDVRFRHVLIDILGILRGKLSIDVQVLETRRDRTRQKMLRKQGASKVNIGWHQFGLAADLGIFADGVYQVDDRLGRYLKLGFVAMAFGCRWGGNWDMDKHIGEGGENDLGHVEYHPGFTLSQYIEAGEQWPALAG